MCKTEHSTVSLSKLRFKQNSITNNITSRFIYSLKFQFNYINFFKDLKNELNLELINYIFISDDKINCFFV